MYRMLFFGYRRFYKGTVTQSCVPLACLWRCKIPGIAGRSQEKLKKKHVKFYLKFLQVEMSPRPDGDRSV